MTTPDKYIPETRQWEQKEWLYEQYWGEMHSTREMSEKVSVSTMTIKRTLKKFGIPLRTTSYNSYNAVSPFAGFYGQKPVPSNRGSNATQYNPDYEKDVSWADGRVTKAEAAAIANTHKGGDG